MNTDKKRASNTVLRNTTKDPNEILNKVFDDDLLLFVFKKFWLTQGIKLKLLIYYLRTFIKLRCETKS